jgi:hypothetical protein
MIGTASQTAQQRLQGHILQHKFSISAVVALTFLQFVASSAAALGVDDVKTGSYANIHKVAIVSAVGSIFRLSNTIGWGKHATLDIADWHIDDLAAATVKKYLGGRFEFVDVNFDHDAVITLPTRMSRETKTKAFLKQLPDPGIDAFLLIHPSQDSDMTGPEGLALGNDGETRLWANFEVDVVDAHTFEFIGEVQAHLQTPEGKHVYAAFAEAPGFWFDPGTPLTPGKKDWLRKQTEELIPRALVECLRALNFGVTLPPPGDHSIAPPALGGGMDEMKSVAVVSALGDKISLVTVNVLSANETKDVSIPDWNLDAEIERIAGDAMAKKFAVKSVPIDRALLAPLLTFAGGRVPALRLPVRDDVDAYVVLLKASTDKGGMKGLGFWSMRPLTGRQTKVFDDFSIVVVDARTLRVIKSAAFATDFLAQDPKFVADSNLWPEKGEADITPDMAKKMRARILTLVADDFQQAFYTMDLGGQAHATAADTPAK